MNALKMLIGGRELVILFICFTLQVVVTAKTFSSSEKKTYKDKVLRMFYNAYDNYIEHAFPYDELRPLSCDGVNTWGSFSLTLIDALDTLAVMGNYSEFRRVSQLITERANFDVSINVSVFETNIRVVGGLLSAHLLYKRMGMPLEPGWPCNGPLLRLAEDMARRLLPAFNTATGMPYGTVNLRHGVPRGETSVTCTAGVSTFIVEFGTLSRLTGDPVFEQVALKSLTALWNARSSIGLVGNHIDVETGKWTALDSGIGAGVDSYYEYLVKGSILLQKPDLMAMLNAYRRPITKYLLKDDWYMWVNMQKGQVTIPVFQSLEAYWPGVLSLIGDLDAALKSLHNYHQVWKQYGFTPEFYNIPNSEVNTNREGYPLRPEFVESVMYLHRATNDSAILEMAVDVLESIGYSAKTSCGYASIKDVRNHQVEDRMESFFLAETTKYLYLLFDSDNFLHNDGKKGSVVNTPSGQCVLENGGYIFNTEAHPIDVAAVYCCSKFKDDISDVQDLEDNLDILSLLDDSNAQRANFLLEPVASTAGSAQFFEDNSNIFEMDETNENVDADSDDLVTQIEPSNSADDGLEMDAEENDAVGQLQWAGTKPSLNVMDRDRSPSASATSGENIGSQPSGTSASDVKLTGYYEYLSCPVQPAHQRLSLMGELFLAALS